MAERVIVRRDGERDLRFTGELVAEVDSRKLPGYVPPLAAAETWDVLRLWKTAGAKYVAGRHEGEMEVAAVMIRQSYSAEVCPDESSVIEFFGFTPTAKALYNAAGFDTAEDVE